MGLSCSCDDFDKGDYDDWCEPGRRSVPPPGTKCCECCAPLPAEPLTCWIHMEVYEPDETGMPPHDVNLWPRLGDPYWPGHPTCSVLERHGEQMEHARDDWSDEHGWDSECDRFERVRSKDYRCERCEGLVAAIEDLGYCMIAPGDLVENHVEYVAEHGQHEIMWKCGADGVWHPRRMTRFDFARREAKRRWRNAVYIVLKGGWKHKVKTIWWRTGGRVPGKVMPRLGYVYRYDYDAKCYRWMQPKKREVA